MLHTCVGCIPDFIGQVRGHIWFKFILFLCWKTITSLLWLLSFILCTGLFCKITRKTNSTYFLPMFFCFHFLLLSFWSICSLLYSKEWGRNPILLYYLFRWQPSRPITVHWIISLFVCVWNFISIIKETCMLEFIFTLSFLCTCATGF